MVSNGYIWIWKCANKRFIIGVYEIWRVIPLCHLIVSSLLRHPLEHNIYPALNLFEQANCIDWIHFCYILTLTEIYIFGTPLRMLHVQLWGPNYKSSSLPLGRKHQKGQSRDTYIILLFNSKYKRQRINVIFLQDKYRFSFSCPWVTIFLHSRELN